MLLGNFEKHHVRCALIGGFALSAAGYTRATRDIDFLVAKEDMPKVKQLMLSLGYDLLHESEDVSNFLGKMTELGRVDFLHAHRKYALRMLERAKETDILEKKFKVRVILPEDLIGLKVQSSSNDPDRYHQDMADIESLMRFHRKHIDMNLIQEYFELFNRGEELKRILEKLKNVE